MGGMLSTAGNAALTGAQYGIKGASTGIQLAGKGIGAAGTFVANHPLETLIAAQSNDPLALAGAIGKQKPSVGPKLASAQEQIAAQTQTGGTSASGPVSASSPAISTPPSYSTTGTVPVTNPSSPIPTMPSPSSPLLGIWNIAKWGIAGYQGGAGFVSLVDGAIDGAKDTKNAEAIMKLTADIVNKDVTSLKEIAPKLKEYNFVPGNVSEWVSTYKMSEELLKYDEESLNRVREGFLKRIETVKEGKTGNIPESMIPEAAKLSGATPDELSISSDRLFWSQQLGIKNISNDMFKDITNAYQTAFEDEGDAKKAVEIVKSQFSILKPSASGEPIDTTDYSLLPEDNAASKYVEMFSNQMPEGAGQGQASSQGHPAQTAQQEPKVQMLSPKGFLMDVPESKVYQALQRGAKLAK